MKVSIIITSYNYAPYIERCVRSCLTQNFDKKNYEVIVVDDASTDKTIEIIKKYAKYPNFRIIQNKKNVGVAESANIGIRESFGQFVVRVDADDYINANLILFLSAYLEANNQLLGVAADYICVNDDEKPLKRFSAQKRAISCGIMYHKDLLVKMGLYNPDFRHREEKELRRRLGDKYRIDYLRIPLYRYRIHGNNKTKQAKELRKFESKIKKLYSEKK